MTIRFDDTEVTTPTLALSVLNGQARRELPAEASTRLTDGLFDYMRDAALTRAPSFATFPAMMRGQLPRKPPVREARASEPHPRESEALCAYTPTASLSACRETA